MGVEPGVGMAQGLLDNYPENNFVTINTADTVSSKRLMQLFVYLKFSICSCQCTELTCIYSCLAPLDYIAVDVVGDVDGQSITVSFQVSISSNSIIKVFILRRI